MFDIRSVLVWLMILIFIFQSSSGCCSFTFFYVQYIVELHV